MITYAFDASMDENMIKFCNENFVGFGVETVFGPTFFAEVFDFLEVFREGAFSEKGFVLLHVVLVRSFEEGRLEMLFINVQTLLVEICIVDTERDDGRYDFFE